MNTDVTIKEDRAPYVKFETKAVEDVAASKERGHYVAKDVDYVIITPAYTKDIFKQKADAWFAQIERQAKDGRFNPAWVAKYKQQFAAWREGKELPLDGTPILGWNVISPGQQETLNRMGIRTVEDAAAMNDDAIRRIGMGAVNIKNKAIASISGSKDTGRLVMENAELRAKLDVAEKTVEQLSTKVRDLDEYVKLALPSGEQDEEEGEPEITASDLIEYGPPKPRRGRPPKKR